MRGHIGQDQSRFRQLHRLTLFKNSKILIDSAIIMQSSKSSKDKSKLKPETWHRHYTEQERRILVQLVLDRFDIIEQNLKDPFTQECKQEAWAEVVQRFNADVRCNHQRDTKQIKKLWDNIKTRAKRMVQDQRLRKTMQGELSSGATGSTTSLQVVGDDGTDLEALAGDSVAEKVIYYMKMIAQPQSSVSFEMDDEEEEEENMHLYTESEYDSMIRSEEDVILCDDDESEPRPPAPKHFALEPQSFPNPPHPVPGPAVPESSEYMGTLSRSYMDQGRDSRSNASKSVRFMTTNHQDVAQPLSSAQQNLQKPSSAPNGTTSRVTMATSSLTTPSYDDGWVAENSGNSRATKSGPATATNSSRGDRRTIKRLRKEEYELKIRKLRLEMKYARIEHEERLKVIRAQQEVLNSLKPDPSSIIGSLFK